MKVRQIGINIKLPWFLHNSKSRMKFKHENKANKILLNLNQNNLLIINKSRFRQFLHLRITKWSSLEIQMIFILRKKRKKCLQMKNRSSIWKILQLNRTKLLLFQLTWEKLQLMRLDQVKQLVKSLVNFLRRNRKNLKHNAHLNQQLNHPLALKFKNNLLNNKIE